MNAGIQEFHDYVLYDCMEGISDIMSKKMFGGFGLYKDGFIFAIITSDSEIYFKVDDDLKKKFEEHGSHPFVYTGHKNKKPTEMPYWLLPEEILEQRDKLLEWIDNSAAVSARK